VPITVYETTTAFCPSLFTPDCFGHTHHSI